MSVTQASESVQFEQAVVAMIDDHADADRPAQRGNMAKEALLLDLHQIRRQQQYAVRPRAFRPAREFRGEAGPIANPGDDRGPAGRGFDRDLDHPLIFVGAEREEFPRPPGGK